MAADKAARGQSVSWSARAMDFSEARLQLPRTCFAAGDALAYDQGRASKLPEQP